MATIAPAEQFRQMEMLADQIEIDLADYGIHTIADELLRLNRVRRDILFSKFQAGLELQYLKSRNRVDTQEFEDLCDTIDLAKMLLDHVYHSIVSVRAISRMISPFASEEAQEQ